MTAALEVRRRRLVAIGLLMVFTGFWLSATSQQARADVTVTSGSAFGVFAGTSLLGTLVAEQPTVQGGSPPINYGPFAQTLLDLNVPTLLRAQNVNVQTFGLLNADPHLNSANSSASIERASVGPDSLVLNALVSSCVADGNGARGATTLASGTLGTNSILGGPIGPNTSVVLPGVLEIVLNEQIFDPPPGTPGAAGITVNGARITVLGSTIPGVPAGLEIILAQSVCEVAGPDVNATTTTTAPTTTTTAAPGTTTTTAAPGTTTTTAAPGTTTTTAAPGTTTTTAAPGTTTTTAAPGTTTTVDPGTTTTLAPGTTTTAPAGTSTTGAGGGATTTVAGTALPRTGAESMKLSALAIAFLGVGAALVMFGMVQPENQPAFARRPAGFDRRSGFGPKSTFGRGSAFGQRSSWPKRRRRMF